MLAHRIGISRVVIDRLLKIPGCPQPNARGFHVQKFIDFAKIHFGKSSDTLDSLPSSAGQPMTFDIVSIRAKQMLAQIAKIEQQMAIERGDYVSRQTLQSKLSGFLTDLDMNFRRQFEQELPQVLEGLSAIEIREKLKAAYRRIKAEFSSKTDTLND